MLPRVWFALFAGAALVAYGQSVSAEDRGSTPATVERSVDAGQSEEPPITEERQDHRLAQRTTPRQPSTRPQPRRPAVPPVPTPPVPTPRPPQPAPAPSAASTSDFALEGATQSLGGAGAPNSVSPYMVGDFFSSGGQFFFPSESQGARDLVVGEIPNAGGSLRVKISDNNSPMPRDRIFYSYNHFANALPLFEQFAMTGAMDVDRHVPGFEKTFWDGLASFELRTPVAYTQNSRVFLNGVGPAKNTEFGNIAAAFKFLLWQNDELAIAAGTGVNVPSADDAQLYQTGDRLLTVKNEAVHIMPYVGFLWRPTNLTYIQSFVQVDVDANGNPVIDDSGVQAGVLNDQTLLYFDISAGFWLFYNPEASFLTGITPMAEFHYTTTLQDADIVIASTSAGTIGLGNVFNQLSIPNVTVGTHFWIGPNSVFTVAAAFPLADREYNRQFDAEVIAQFNRFF